MMAIWGYIIIDIQLTNKSEAQKQRIKAARFCIFRGKLYKRSFFGSLLKCLGPKVALKVVEKMHESHYENHSGVRSMTLMIMLQGYYRPTLLKYSE